MVISYYFTQAQDSLSVDLTTFPGNILGSGHPTVNKAPILALEVFGVMDGQPAYPGTLIFQGELLPG